MPSSTSPTSSMPSSTMCARIEAGRSEQTSEQRLHSVFSPRADAGFPQAPTAQQSAAMTSSQASPPLPSAASAGLLWTGDVGLVVDGVVDGFRRFHRPRPDRFPVQRKCSITGKCAIAPARQVPSHTADGGWLEWNLSTPRGRGRRLSASCRGGVNDRTIMGHQ